MTTDAPTAGEEKIPKDSWVLRNAVLYPLSFGFESHLFGHPQTHGTPDEAEPDHEVVLVGADERRHGLSKQTRVDEEGGNARDRVVLIGRVG